MKSLKYLFTLGVLMMFLNKCWLILKNYRAYPTSTTIEKRFLNENTHSWPSFILCPVDGVDLSVLKKDKGYSSMSEFIMGRMDDGKRGWGGYKNESFQKIFEDCRKVKNVE